MILKNQRMIDILEVNSDAEFRKLIVTDIWILDSQIKFIVSFTVGSLPMVLQWSCTSSGVSSQASQEHFPPEKLHTGIQDFTPCLSHLKTIVLLSCPHVEGVKRQSNYTIPLLCPP